MLITTTAGVEIFVNSQVDKILVDDVKGAGGKSAKAVGVQLSDGRKLMAKQVISTLNFKKIYIFNFNHH